MLIYEYAKRPPLSGYVQARLWPTSSLRALNIPKCCEFSRPETC
jgi:hypothetical protein